jgi:hypothetical protein
MVSLRPVAAPSTVESDLDRLVRRLRGLSPRAWRAPGRRAALDRLAAALVALGEPGHELPPLPDHALGDVVAVLAAEALQKGRRDEVAAALRRALEETR